MMKTNKFTTTTLLILIVMAYSLMPIVARIFSTFFTTYAYLGVAVLTVLSILLIGGQKFFQDLFAVFIPLLTINVLAYFTSGAAITLTVYSLLIDMLAVCIGIYVWEYCGFKIIKILTFALFIIYAITMLTTIIGLNENPDAARYLATVADASEADAVKYGWLNIGGFQFVYSVAIFYPAVIYGFKVKKINVVVLIIYAVFDFLLILNSGYTISLLVFITTTVFIFLKKDLRVKEVLIIFFVSLVLIIALFPLVSMLLNGLSEIVDNDIISDRLYDLAGGREGLENSEDNRLELYMMSVNGFLSNPIFGGLFEKVSNGGHSQILDTIANYGIFGLIAMFLTYAAIYKKFFKPYRNNVGYGYILWIFMQAVILMILNPGMWLYELCMFVPIVLMYIDKKGNSDENTLDSKLGSQRVKYQTL